MLQTDRESIRLLVENYGEEIVSFGISGGNPGQKALDKQDELESLIADLPESEQVEFQRIFDEEVAAWAQQHEINLQSQIEASDASTKFWMSVIGAFFGIAIVLIILN